jgi:hypothetical protein
LGSSGFGSGFGGIGGSTSLASSAFIAATSSPMALISASPRGNSSAALACCLAFAAEVTRANPISAQVAAGNVWILRAPWNEAFLTEADSFPGGTHDDQIDGLSGASSILMGSQATDIAAALTQQSYLSAISQKRTVERSLDG